MAVNAASLKKWAEDNLPPMSWMVICSKTAGEFIDAGINPTKMPDDTEIPEGVLAAIRSLVSDKYNAQTPF